MNKDNLSERDIGTKHITPALEKAGWLQRQIREEVSFTREIAEKETLLIRELSAAFAHHFSEEKE